MQVFAHHLYEYKKGLRRLILHTTHSQYKELIRKKLDARGIAYIITDVTDSKINIFFGSNNCIAVLKTFPHLDLKDLPPDKDFILGAMLGYEMELHCRRYLNRLERKNVKSA